jgi:hypothetical protein
MATWRSGYAAVCKTVYPGSIPGVASNLINHLRSNHLRSPTLRATFCVSESSAKLAALSYCRCERRRGHAGSGGAAPDGVVCALAPHLSGTVLTEHKRRLVITITSFDGRTWETPHQQALSGGGPQPPTPHAVWTAEAHPEKRQLGSTPEALTFRGFAFLSGSRFLRAARCAQTCHRRGGLAAPVSGALTDEHCRHDEGIWPPRALVRASCPPLAPSRELVPTRFQPQTLSLARRCTEQKLES